MEALYYEFETQESLLSYAAFMNDKIIEHEVRQACHAWILEFIISCWISIILESKYSIMLFLI